jgi:hypothetical protein
MSLLDAKDEKGSVKNPHKSVHGNLYQVKENTTRKTILKSDPRHVIFSL